MGALRQGFALGHLSVTTFEFRLGRALSARCEADLEVLLSDVPETAGGESAQPAHRVTLDSCGAAVLHLGRDARSDVVITGDDTVSRLHAALVRRQHRWFVIDLGSTNGTTVNGVPVREREVHPGDRVGMGASTVSLVA